MRGRAVPRLFFERNPQSPISWRSDDSRLFPLCACPAGVVRAPSRFCFCPGHFGDHTRPGSAAAPLPLPLAGQDRLPLRRRHLDGQPEWRRGRAAYLQRASGRGPVLLARRRLDRLLGPPERQHRRLHHPRLGRRTPPHHLAPGGQRRGGMVAGRQGSTDRQHGGQLSPLPAPLPRSCRRLWRSRAAATALRLPGLLLARRPIHNL